MDGHESRFCQSKAKLRRDLDVNSRVGNLKRKNKAGFHNHRLVVLRLHQGVRWEMLLVGSKIQIKTEKPSRENKDQRKWRRKLWNGKYS